MTVTEIPRDHAPPPPRPYHEGGRMNARCLIIHVYFNMFPCISTGTLTHTQACMHVCMYARMHVCRYACSYVGKHVLRYTHGHTRRHAQRRCMIPFQFGAGRGTCLVELASLLCRSLRRRKKLPDSAQPQLLKASWQELMNRRRRPPRLATLSKALKCRISAALWLKNNFCKIPKHIM